MYSRVSPFRSLRADVAELERISDELDRLAEEHYDGEGTELGVAFDRVLEGLEIIERRIRRELEEEERATYATTTGGTTCVPSS